jgi:hypothetical protein
MKKELKVAIIGVGTIGTVVATNLVKGKRSIIIADRTLEKAKTLSQKLGSLTKAATIVDAIKEADIVVFAVWFNAIKELFVTYYNELQGKIVVDPSNPIAPNDKGGFVKIINKDESAGEVLSSLLPSGAKFAKALGTLNATSLSEGAFQNPAKVLFYATNDTTIHEVIEQLIRDNGFEPVFLGGIDQSIRIEVFGDLHEFGALGKTVTASEAKEKLQALVS